MSVDLAAVVDAASRPFVGDRFLYHYARGKMRGDPAYPVLARLLREAEGEGGGIFDMGCGAGIFAAYLRESGVRAPLRGVDLDAGKIRFAEERVARAYGEMRFETGDVFDCPLSGRHIVALDVLHYFDDERQELLLRRMAVAVRESGGRLFVRNGIRDAGWRHWVTTVEEALVRSTRWIRGGAWNFPRGKFIEGVLRGEGLAVVSTPMWAGTPFGSYLFVAAREGACSGLGGN